MEDDDGTGLDPDAILTEEFEYAAETAYQAHEDRVQVFYQFLAAAATVLAAVFFVEDYNPVHFSTLSLLLFTFTVVGVFSLLKLARLRTAWRESVQAMCQIKDYYVTHGDDPNLEEAFLWTEDTIPAGVSSGTVAYYLALTVSFINSGTLVGALFIGSLAVWRGILAHLTIIPAVLAVVFVTAWYLQMRLWFLRCRAA